MSTTIDGTNSSTFPADASINGLTVGRGGGAQSDNTALGTSALNANTTGGQNTAVGYSSGITNISGTQNSFFGRFSGYYATGSLNTAIGSGALNGASGTSTGSYNTGVGTGALGVFTSGSENTAIGATKTASYNAALGQLTSGSYNVAVGNGSLQANTTASNNTAVGYQAGYTATTNISNCFIGAKAGYAATGANNTYVGAYNSGGNGSGSAMTSGNSNTILGGYTGNQGGLDIRTSSNNIVLSDGDGNIRQYIDSSGKVYIACTSAPSSTVAGVRLGNPNDALCAFSSGTATVETYQLGFYNGNGLVGRISTNGSATTYSTSSDYRLKETIAPMTGALAKVALLKPVTYKWKADGSDGEGFIAHELAEVCPHAVSGEKDAIDADGNPDYQAVDTSFLVATLTAAIQELKTIVDAQATEITALKAKVGI